MMDVLLVVARAIAGVVGYYEEREGADAEDHVKSGLAIALVGLLLSVIVQLELFIRGSFPTIGILPTLPTTFIPLPAGMEVLYSVISMLDFLVIYGLAAVVAKLIGVVSKKIK